MALMSGRAIWKGFISFGEVNIPVNLHTAVREERIQFHLLHKRDHARLRQQMICAYEKVPVPSEAQAKGFEVEEGKYILVDPEELEQADPEAGREIEVHEFVGSERIDPIYLERAYYLGPEAQAKGYEALAAALAEMGAAGICTWTMRKRSYLGALQSTGKALRLNAMRYADEVVSARTLELQKIALSEKELKIGINLINQLTVPFQPGKFEDEHQKRLQALIDKKARGEKIAVLRPRRLKATEPDKLLQVLEASLKKVA
ncbi:MAG TPA: Ku protein [Thermodesulfovibrionales bacterium]|nr:Ku protein [Thermodesulfovibrionales bacterium]